MHKVSATPEGFVFKTGGEGTGLYRDDRRITIAIAELVGPVSGVVPVQLRRSEDLSDEMGREGLKWVVVGIRWGVSG